MTFFSLLSGREIAHITLGYADTRFGIKLAIDLVQFLARAVARKVFADYFQGVHAVGREFRLPPNARSVFRAGGGRRPLPLVAGHPGEVIVFGAFDPNFHQLGIRER